MSGIREVPEGLVAWERISAHSHITGLGLEGLKAKFIGDGMVGQIEAREAAGIITRLIKEGKFAGRAILMAGPPGTGKTAIAVAIAKELGKDVPFVPIAASEVYSTEMKKTEFLTQALRKAIGVRIHEVRKIYEGVVRELSIQKEPHPYNPYMQVPVGAVMRLATVDESKKLTMDQSFAMQIVQQGIETGDIVQIDADGGRITKLGKSRQAVEEKKVDLTAIEVLDIPSGPVMKEKEFVYTLTLHQLDIMNSRSGGSIFSLLFSSSSGREIDAEVRKEVDNAVRGMVQSKKAEIIPGVVFIDECSMLDVESFAFLNRALEQDLCPIIIFATNRGVTTIRGTDIRSPHGMPLDLLDRLLIVNTRPYNAEEIRKILEIRARAEKMEIEDEALNLLTKIGVETSLRHAVQLMAPAKIIAESENLKTITKAHIEKANFLFADIKRSVNYLHEYEKQFLV